MKQMLSATILALFLGFADPSLAQLAVTSAQPNDTSAATFLEVRAAAERGNTQAQDYLGFMYISGHGVARDDTQAVMWLRKAAEQGYAPAQHKLGMMYEIGRGVLQDDTQAVAWYRKAAEQKYIAAQYDLGIMYASSHYQKRGVDESLPDNGMSEYIQLAKRARSGEKAAIDELTVRTVDKSDNLARTILAYFADSNRESFLLRNSAPSDVDQALFAFQPMADLGLSTGQRGMTMLLLSRRNQYSDDTKRGCKYGVALYANPTAIRARYDGYENAVLHVIGCYLQEGTGFERDPAKAADILTTLVEQKYKVAIDLTSNLDGMPASLVSAVQRILKQRGLYDGLDDGQPNHQTIAAIRALAGAQPAVAQTHASSPNPSKSVQTDNKDLAARFHETRSAAERGEASAQHSLGLMYDQGLGVAQDYTEAVAWYLKAAGQGNADAQSRLGQLYAAGKGVAQDPGQALAWFRKAADQGVAGAQFALGMAYFTGRGVVQDRAQADVWLSKAVASYSKAAAEGNAVAQNQLGIMYMSGLGVARDYSQSVTWFRKAADQGVAAAQFWLGQLYENGSGVAQDYIVAAAWYRKASDQGFTNAQYSLGRMQRMGNGAPAGITKDEAIASYKAAAEHGHAQAQCDLGEMYENGWDVVQDDTQAINWYRKAASQELAQCQYKLGTMYENGKGVGLNYAEAVTWYKKAADKNEWRAQRSLGVMYQNGWGVPQDYTQAIAWYRKAADKGDTYSKEALRKIETRTPDTPR